MCEQDLLIEFRILATLANHKQQIAQSYFGGFKSVEDNPMRPIVSATGVQEKKQKNLIDLIKSCNN